VGDEPGAVLGLDAHAVRSRGCVDVQSFPQGRGRGTVVAGAEVDPVGGEYRLQLRRRALGDDPAVVDDGDAVAALRLVEVVGGQEERGRLPFADVIEVRPHLGACLRVQADGGFVQEQHARAVEQAAGDLQPSPHAAGEGAYERVAACRQADEIQHRVDPGGQRRAREGVQVGVEAEVLPGREVPVQRGLLEDETETAPHPPGRRPRVVPGDLDPAGRGDLGAGGGCRVRIGLRVG
jgi:hypothetical protein